MSSWASWFGGKRAPPTKDATRETIVELRQHLLTMEKKDDFLTKKIEEETQKAKNALLTGGTNGKAVATAALRRKKTHEAELEKLYGMRATIEAQVSPRPRLLYYLLLVETDWSRTRPLITPGHCNCMMMATTGECDRECKHEHGDNECYEERQGYSQGDSRQSVRSYDGLLFDGYAKREQLTDKSNPFPLLHCMHHTATSTRSSKKWRTFENRWNSVQKSRLLSQIQWRWVKM